MNAYSQRDYNWVFGDSVGINFNSAIPTIDTTRKISTLEPAASISDMNGSLLFYVGAASIAELTNNGRKFIVRNNTNSIILNGDSLAGNTSMTQGILILNDPADTNEYYIFHISYNSPGNLLCYSKVNMTLNGGAGQVISSNNILSDSMSEKLYAVKAANGRDWWVISTGNSPTNFYKYKIDTTGIHGPFLEPATPSHDAWDGQIIFSPSGNEMFLGGGPFNSYLFDFDRCLGQFSNPVVIDSNNYVHGIYGCSFSHNSKYLYISSHDSLWQFDLTSSNIFSSKMLIFNLPTNLLQYGIGQHMLGPDGKIYIANESDLGGNPPDSFNTHLNVIQYPDSGGTTCGFLPFSFSLNGRRSFLSLPNMPNYNLGTLEGVNCDSILAASVTDNLKQGDFIIYPNPAKRQFYITWKRRDVELVKLELYTMQGIKVEEMKEHIDEFKPVTFHLSPGTYVVKILVDGKGVVFKKVVVIE